MHVQRTRTKHLRAPNNNNARVSKEYAVQFQLMFVQLLIGLMDSQQFYYSNNYKRPIKFIIEQEETFMS